MWSLIYKDILLSKRMVPMIFAYGILMIIVFDSSIGVGTAGFIATTVAITYLMLTRAAAYDDMDKAEVMVLSLPISRNQVVIAKYLSVIVFALIGMISYGVALLVFKLLPISIAVSSVSVESIVGMIFAIVLMAGLYFPVYFKVGYLKSRMFTLILFLIAFFVPSFFVAAVQQGELEWLQGLAMALENQSEAVILSAILGSCVLILIISLGLSLNFYRRREF